MCAIVCVVGRVLEGVEGCVGGGRGGLGECVGSLGTPPAVAASPYTHHTFPTTNTTVFLLFHTPSELLHLPGNILLGKIFHDKLNYYYFYILHTNLSQDVMN